jgi:hypothetical protein
MLTGTKLCHLKPKDKLYQATVIDLMLQPSSKEGCRLNHKSSPHEIQGSIGQSRW